MVGFLPLTFTLICLLLFCSLLSLFLLTTFNLFLLFQYGACISSGEYVAETRPFCGNFVVVELTSIGCIFNDIDYPGQGVVKGRINNHKIIQLTSNNHKNPIADCVVSNPFVFSTWIEVAETKEECLAPIYGLSFFLFPLYSLSPNYKKNAPLLSFNAHNLSIELLIFLFCKGGAVVNSIKIQWMCYYGSLTQNNAHAEVLPLSPSP